MKSIGLPVPATAVIRVDRSLSFRIGSNCLGPNPGILWIPHMSFAHAKPIKLENCTPDFKHRAYHDYPRSNLIHRTYILIGAGTRQRPKRLCGFHGKS